MTDCFGRYSIIGWKLGHDPNRMFSTAFYLEQNPDVTAAGLNPLQHSAQEGRSPSPSFDTPFYLSHNSDVAAAGLNPYSTTCNEARMRG